MDNPHENFDHLVGKFKTNIEFGTFLPHIQPFCKKIDSGAVKFRGAEDGNSGGAWKGRI